MYEDTEGMSLEEFKATLRRQLEKEYPKVKGRGQQAKAQSAQPKKPKVVIKPLAELREEARAVHRLMAETPVLPEKAGEVYHILSMEWF